MLKLTDVRAGYGGHEVLHGISHTFETGKNYCLLGPNGCGKTTLARAMAALPKLRDCEMHSTCMLHSGDEGTLRKMGLRLTSEPEYPSKDLFF